MPHTPRPVSKALRKMLRVAARPMKSDKGRGGVVVNAYRGYGSPREVYVMGRVFRQLRMGVPIPNDTLLQDLVDVFRRFLRWGAKHVDVTLSLEGHSHRVTTDRDGYYQVHMTLDEPLPTEKSWHEGHLHISLRDERTVDSSVDIYIPPAMVDLAVISDIDDTVMYTGVANKLKMMYRLFFRKAHQRMAFPGVAEFYQALFAGADGRRQRPLLYVSRGPWSIYEVLEEFFQRNNIPVGPILFLREWGLTVQRPLPRKAEDHKEKLIKQMLALYGELPFVLIGDSGQHDPETYARIVREHPGRIKAIYIRDVNHDPSRDEAIARLAREVAADGCSLLLTDDSARMAEHAHDLGLISEDGLETVRQAPQESA